MFTGPPRRVCVAEHQAAMRVSYPDDAAVWTVPLSLSLRDAGWQEAAVRRQYPHAPARTVCASEITVSGVEVHDLGQPEAVIRYPLGATYQVRLARRWSATMSCGLAGARRHTRSPRSAPARVSCITGALSSEDGWVSEPMRARS
jgi:hypothetical protein